jgi:hypothetical protein
MRGHRIAVAAELIAEGKQLYEETDTPVRVIAARMGLTRSTLNYRIADWKWVRRRASDADPPPAPVESPAPVAVAPPPSEPAAAEPPLPFPERLRRVIDAQMRVAERTLKVLGPASSAEAERTSRILATVSRTVQEITATAQGRMPADDADDDPVPRDIDEFRLELARRIRCFVDARRLGAVRIPGEPETPLG